MSPGQAAFKLLSRHACFGLKAEMSCAEERCNVQVSHSSLHQRRISEYHPGPWSKHCPGQATTHKPSLVVLVGWAFQLQSNLNPQYPFHCSELRRHPEGRKPCHAQATSPNFSPSMQSMSPKTIKTTIGTGHMRPRTEGPLVSKRPNDN